MNERICPKCKKSYTEHYAISRINNKKICPRCGLYEAIKMMCKYERKKFKKARSL